MDADALFWLLSQKNFFRYKTGFIVSLLLIFGSLFPCFGEKKPVEEFPKHSPRAPAGEGSPKHSPGARPGEGSMNSRLSSLEELRDMGEFDVKVVGAGEKAAVSGKSGAYVEWIYGEKNGDQWTSFSIGYSTDTSIKLITPKGEIEISAGKIRLFLKPSVSVFAKPGEKSKLSETVKRIVEEEKRHLTFEEYRLDEGKTYFARLHSEGYHLPPRPPSFKPVRRQNTVLQISDTPFKEGKSGSPITPKYKNWKY